jgi:tetratricopeptide (TPR) repeat protein
LEPDIKAAELPTRKTAIRIADRARRDLLRHEPDEAIRTLGPALSIDAGNPYVYFYLGRAYLMKHNYEQALTFWDRAAIGFADNPKWLSEVLSFEGEAKERLGDIDQARNDFGRALKLAPDNQLANDGYSRLAPPPPPPEAEPSAEMEPGNEEQPPPEEAEPPPPPSEEEPPPAEEPMPGEAPSP